MLFCLSPEEVGQLLDEVVLKDPIQNPELVSKMELADGFIEEVALISYFAARELEARISDNPSFARAADQLYERCEDSWISVHEFSPEFVDFMFRHLRDTDLNLADQIVALHESLISHDYSRTV